jgi:exodeoxyribonuclease V alpha subunit
MSTAASRLLVRRWGLPADALRVVDGFLSAWADGHTLIDLEPDEIELLTSSTAVSDGSRQTPLVLRDGRLQSWRLHMAEGRVARRLHELVTRAPIQDEFDPKSLDTLFPDVASAQRHVATVGMQRQFVLVTGGPGTGKTTVAARLLVLLASRDTQVRMALAAPTARAAVRLGEAFAGAVTGLGDKFERATAKLMSAATAPRTVHRLLGWNPYSGQCRFHADNPLPYDVIVIDEASMLDLMLWDRLLEALAPDTQLVILGDHRQLESVGAGRVLGELVVAGEAGLLNESHVELNRNYRFDEQDEIGRLADAIKNHDGASAVREMTDPKQGGAVVRYASGARADAVDAMWPNVLDVIHAKTPEQAHEALARVRVLCAVNEGPYGSDGMNTLIDNRLREEGVVTGSGAHGRPVIVRVNDNTRHNGLNNGDVGVVLHGVGNHESGVYFPTVAGGRQMRRVSIEAMPRHDTAWALTVHRAQGSEFDAVLLVLPPTPSEHDLVSSELLYTGVTRARSRVLVVADEASVLDGCQRREVRRTGFMAQLRLCEAKN